MAEIALSQDEAEAFGASALERIGFSAEEARVVARHLVESELCGRNAHYVEAIARTGFAVMHSACARRRDKTE